MESGVAVVLDTKVRHQSDLARRSRCGEITQLKFTAAGVFSA